MAGQGVQRQTDRDAAKAAWIAEAYRGVPFLAGPRKPRSDRPMPASARGVPGGRNRCRAAIRSVRAKWMARPVAAQIHPERHIHPRAKRRA